MAELRLDDLEAAFEQTSDFDIGTAEPDKFVQNLNIPLDQLEMFNTQPEIKRKSYDEWYERGLKFLSNTSDNPVLDVAGESAAGVLQYVPSISNMAVLGVTDFIGQVTESFSSPEAFQKGLAELAVAVISAEVPTVTKSAFKDPTPVDPESFRVPEGANVFERTGKNMRALSFYGYANTKAFQQQLLADADHPLVQQVAGAFGSISTSALLATVNPKLAMWAIGGHEGANFYLEQVSRGVDWKPAAGYGALIGVGVAKLEKMSINILYKKFSSKLALMGDSAVVNGVEEFSQSLFVSGVEQGVGAENRTIGEIFKQAAFEAAIGAFGGGVAGASTMQFAYARMDKRLKKMGIKKKMRQATIMRSMAEGTSILENLLMEGLGATQADLDIARKVANGEMDANEGMLELNKRMNERLKERGIDTYLDSDPDALIEEEQAKDAVAEIFVEGRALTPEEAVELGLTQTTDAEGDVIPTTAGPPSQETVTELEALQKVSNFVASHDLGPQRIEDGEGNVTAIVNPGMPDGLEGVTTRQIDAVLKNVKSGKKLTEKQEEVKQKLLVIADEMGLPLQGAPTQAQEETTDGKTKENLEQGVKSKEFVREANPAVGTTEDEVVVELVSIEEVERFRSQGRTEGDKFEGREGIEKLKEDIRKNGIKNPLLIEFGVENGKALLIEGNTRLQAAKELGLKFVPVKVVRAKNVAKESETSNEPVDAKLLREFRHIPTDLKPSEIGIPVFKETEPTAVEIKEAKLLREGRAKQINQELDALETEINTLLKELKIREGTKKPTKGINQKLDKLGEKVGELLDEAELLPTAQREELAAKIIAVKGKKVSVLRNRAEVIAARIEKGRVTAQFKAEKADLKAARDRLTKYVRNTFKGGIPIPKKMLTRINQVTPKTIDGFMKEVDQARADIVRPNLMAQISNHLNRIAAKVKGGKAVGNLKSAALQDEASNLIRVSKIDARTAQQVIANKQALLNNYFTGVKENGGDTKEINVDKLSREIEVLQNLSGLDEKSEEQLLDSLEYAKGEVKRLKDGSKAFQEIIAEQRETERGEIIDQMKKPAKHFKWLKSFTNFSTNNLSSMLRSLIGKKDINNSTLKPKIDALEQAPRKDAAFKFFYTDGLNTAAKRIFGLKTGKEFTQWEGGRFAPGSGYQTQDPVLHNDGTAKPITLSLAEVSYWYSVTHDQNGNEIAEEIEKFTNDNERKALEERAIEEDMSEEEFKAEEKKIRGNGIPIEHWNQMMTQFKSDQRNVEFSNVQKVLYNTVYSIINPVYRRYTGATLPRVGNFVPWWRDAGIEGEVYSALEDFAERIQTTPRSSNLRIPGATAAFRVAADTEVFQYFIQEMSHFNAFALPMKDIISVVRNKDVRNEINRATGGVEQHGGKFKDSEAYVQMRQLADFIMSRGKSVNEFAHKGFQTMRTNLSVHYLGEPSKAVLQTSSMFMALTEEDVGWVDWAVAMNEFREDPQAVFDLLNKAPMMKFRYADMMIEMKEAIEFSKQKKKTLGGKISKFIIPKSFVFVRAGNKVGAGISGYAVMRKVFKDTGDINEAFRRFDQHIVNQQQSGVATQLSPFQIGQNIRILSQFQSAVIQYARIYVQSYTDLAKGRISLKKFVDRMLVFHVLMPMMRWFLKGLIRGLDFEERDLAVSVAMGPLVAGAFIPDIIQGLVAQAAGTRSFGAESALAGGVNKIGRAARKVEREIKQQLAGKNQDSFDLADAMIEAAGAVASISAPVPGVAFDMAQAVLKMLEGDLTTSELISVMMGESVESLEFKKKKGNNNKRNSRAFR